VSVARQHHWIPQCYLKGFARNRTKNGKLTVFDLHLEREFETIARNVGGARDFNKMEIEGASPDAIEQSLSQLETKFDKVLFQVIQNNSLPTGDDLILLMNFVALMHVRNPRMRETWRRAQADVAEHIMDIALSSKSQWEHQIGQLRADGVEVPVASYEDMKRFHESKEYEITVPTVRHIELEMDLLSSLIPLLLERNWTLFVAPPGSGGFVTSDNPVSLFWNDGKRRRYPPGHGLLNTEVVCPISKELLMSGVFDGQDRVLQANVEDVARANSITISHAERQIYGSTRYFQYLRPDRETVGHGSTLFADKAVAKKRGN
jgi:hypothetical protein